MPGFTKDVTFDWTQDQPHDNFVDFSGRGGPTRVLDGSVGALGCFQLYFTDELFEMICNWTHANAMAKIERFPEKHKGEWHKPTTEEMKAFFGL